MSKPTVFFQWIVDSETPPGKRIRTRHKMTREQAVARHGETAEPVLSSREVRDLPETDAERLGNTHTARGRVPPQGISES